MQLSRGHIDSLLGASFSPAYITPVSVVSDTSQPSEYSPNSFQVLSSVTVSVVNDPIMENVAGKIVVTAVHDAGTGGSGGSYGYVTDYFVVNNEDYSNYNGTKLPTNADNPNLGNDDPYIPTSTQERYAFGQLGDYHIVGFSSAGILVGEGGDLEGNTPYNPNAETYFVISATNLGVNPGAQLTFSRYGEFDGVLGSGVGGGGTGAAPPSNRGQASIWEMNGTNIVSGGPIAPNPGPSWRAVGMGDLGHVLWQNTNTGQISIWEINGNTLIGGGGVSPNPGPSWRAIGTGDFNDDGRSDVLWQNAANGQASIWEMSGNSLIGGGAVTPNPGGNWRAVGTGDFNDDGRSDVLWQNANGQASIWEMNGSSLIGGGAVTPNPGPAWQAVGTRVRTDCSEAENDGRGDADC
jgi:hypothetical protein